MRPDHPAQRMVDEDGGFTLIELLVAMTVVILLAGIGITGFLSRRVSGGDAVAKDLAHAASQAANTYVLENGYGGLTPAALKSVERTINIVANGQAVLAAAASTPSGYTLAVVSGTANTFTVANVRGAVTRTCVVAAGNGDTTTNTGGGCSRGAW